MHHNEFNQSIIAKIYQFIWQSLSIELSLSTNQCENRLFEPKINLLKSTSDGGMLSARSLISKSLQRRNKQRKKKRKPW